MSKKLRYWVIGITVFLCGSAMAVMLYFAAHKSIAVTEISSSGKEFGSEVGQETEKTRELHFQKKEEDAEYLYIPLQEGITAEEVSVENRYLQRELWVYIQGISEEFYRKAALYGNDSAILAGDCRKTEDGVMIRLKMKEAFECVSTVGNGRLSICFRQPKELYDRIAVVDFLPDSSWERSVLTGVQEEFRRIETDTNTRIYCFDCDETLSDEEKLALLSEWQPDFYLQISIGESEETEDFGVGISYPAAYFIPGFGNIAFADLVEKNVAEALQTRGNGFMAAGEENVILQTCGVPCGNLWLGYGTNRAEKKRLSEKEVQTEAANAVYTAFLQAWEQCGK